MDSRGLQNLFHVLAVNAILILAGILGVNTLFTNVAHGQQFSSRVTANHYLREDMNFRQQLARWEQRKANLIQRQRQQHERQIERQRRENLRKLERARMQRQREEMMRKREQERREQALRRNQRQQQSNNPASFNRGRLSGTSAQQPQVIAPPQQAQQPVAGSARVVLPEPAAPTQSQVQQQPEPRQQIAVEQSKQDVSDEPQKTSIFTHLRKALW